MFQSKVFSRTAYISTQNSIKQIRLSPDVNQHIRAGDLFFPSIADLSCSLGDYDMLDDAKVWPSERETLPQSFLSTEQFVDARPEVEQADEQEAVMNSVKPKRSLFSRLNRAAKNISRFESRYSRPTSYSSTNWDLGASSEQDKVVFTIKMFSTSLCMYRLS
ncbi:unnamed protein product [Gongylonema pulchrum]|uniref:Uncharacterized protein n=1 Tax=Gongylonema pulchrum TaxID=637853 RepID=A0A183DKR9_9BILA|nr:unnamed protein product [Gongylonema pulchrum]